MKLSRLGAFFLVPALFTLSGLGAQEGREDGPSSYARVSTGVARIFNMPDAKATEVHKPAKETLLAVHRDTGKWLEVEVPGGYAVWVFGRYLTETADADIYRVNGNGVNLRPRPSSGVANFPLGQQLYAGDQVRVIERADPALPLAEDWVRIWSPAGVRAWIAKESTALLAAGQTGGTLWAQALASLPPAPARAKAVKNTIDAGTPARPKTQPKTDSAAEDAKFTAALEAAWKRMEDERSKATPDWPAVRALFGEAEAAAPGGAEIAQVRQGLEAVTALEEASSLRAELELEREKREEAARREQERIWATSKEKDPLGGVFLVRGALERVVRGEGEDIQKQYFVKFGKDIVSEIVCVSGRYDLDLFVGYQIGVRGTELRNPETDGLRRVEVARLEVTARRP